MGARGGVDRLHERGSVMPIMLVLTVALATLAIGGAAVGRMVAVKLDSQRATDAFCLAALHIVRERGLPLRPADQANALTIGALNSNLPTHTGEITTSETATHVNLACTWHTEMAIERVLDATGITSVGSRASAQLSQTVYDEATRRLPKLVLVLDYSGSMNQRLPGGGGATAIQVLEESILNLLADPEIELDYGAAFYSSTNFAEVAIGPAAPAQIAANIAARGAGGATCTSCGLNTARALLAAADDTGRYVLLVSDGAPNYGGGAGGSRTAADALWAIDATIITLHIDWSGGADVGLANFMRSISGPPDAHPDSDYYRAAADAATLVATFRDIVASIICTVGPITPLPTDPTTVRAFLRSGGGEVPVPQVPDCADPVPPGAPPDGVINARDLAFCRDGLYSLYDAPSGKVKVTRAACDRVRDFGDDIVIRFGAPSLTE